jgi:hypothetical protein
MVLTGGAIAWLVYRHVGVGVLRRTWFNLDLLWGVLLIVVGTVALKSHTSSLVLPIYRRRVPMPHQRCSSRGVRPMITNTDSRTNIHEIAEGIYRINTPISIPGAPGQFSFNQYLIGRL